MRNSIRALLVALTVVVATPAAMMLAASSAQAEDLIDINSATQPQLEALPGIGPVRAAAIIKGRPYKGKNELHEKKIITKALYDKIKDMIIAKQK